MQIDETHRLDLSLNELSNLLAYLEIPVSPPSPLAASDLPAVDPIATGPRDLLEEWKDPICRKDLTNALWALAAPSSGFSIRRGNHRQPPDILAALGTRSSGSYILADLTGSDTLVLRFPLSRQELVDWLVEPFSYLPMQDLPLASFPQLGLSGLSVVLGCADLFRRKYPNPDPIWEPDEALVFNVDELYALLDDGWSGRDPHSLIRAYDSLMGTNLPVFQPAELEPILFMLVNEGLLDIGNGDFILGAGFTWALRCLAWWDLSLALVSLDPTSAAAGPDLFAIQASAMWFFDRLTVGKASLVRLHAEDGAELTRRVSAWVNPLKSTGR